MKILFISSGISEDTVSPIIRSQGNSLTKYYPELEVDYFPIGGKGIIGYLKAISKLRKYLRANKFDIIHAHYSLSAFVAGLAGAKPLVASLMGSDVKANGFSRMLIVLFKKYFWDATIVKSKDMQHSLNLSNLSIVPNGVDTRVFSPEDRRSCQEKLGWDITKKHILFPSNPERPEKNFQLFSDAIKQINDDTMEIHTMVNVPHADVPIYMNATDVVVLTSLWEGSPNALKEAMACNRPIVTTKVGDVEWLLEHVSGCFLSEFDIDDVAQNIINALIFSKENGTTNGRERVLELGLDSKDIAKRLINTYSKTIHENH